MVNIYTVRPSSGLYYVDDPQAGYDAPGEVVGGGLQWSDDSDDTYARLYTLNRYPTDGSSNITLGPMQMLRATMYDPLVAQIDPESITAVMVGARLSLTGTYDAYPGVDLIDGVDTHGIVNGFYDVEPLSRDGVIREIEDIAPTSFWDYSYADILNLIATPDGCSVQARAFTHGKTYPQTDEVWMNVYEAWVTINYLGDPIEVPPESTVITGRPLGTARRFYGA